MKPHKDISLSAVIAIVVCSVNAASAMTYGYRTGQPTVNPKTIRKYFLTAERLDWDYLPQGKNLATDDNGPIQDTLTNGPDRVGSVFSKYVYKQYTDASFSQEIAKPSWQGYVGPLLRAEVGEEMKIVFYNKADRPLSVHPHGLLYDKANEGALYVDQTMGADKEDDGVPPGNIREYTWRITADFAPTADDDNCVPWAYHSHVNPDKEVNSGLLGLLLVCKKGTLNHYGVRKDMDREIVLFVDAIHEDESWLIDENLGRCQNPVLCKSLFDSKDPDFFESLSKDSINGYMFGNLPGLRVCDGERVAWYIFSLNAELHPIHVNGQTFTYHHHRKNVVGIWSATFAMAKMIPRNVGRWLVSCLNFEHRANGMAAFLDVDMCASQHHRSSPVTGVTRQYFLLAKEEDWDYAPTGMNVYENIPLTAPGSESAKYFEKSPTRIGGNYTKSRFVQYDDALFTKQTTRKQEELHLALLGPVIRAEVGDTIQIKLKNSATHPVSIYLQGTSLTKANDGSWLKISSLSDVMGGKVLQPYAQGTYEFYISSEDGPTPEDPDCVPTLYYSGYKPRAALHSGLVGPTLICKKGALDRYTGRQHLVNREMFLLYASIDENLSFHIDTNIAKLTGIVDESDPDFYDSNVMQSVNGRSFGNLDHLDVCQGEEVAWHLLSFGETEGLHSVTFNGNNVMIAGVNRDSHVIISGMGVSALMHPDNLGTWSVHCHNNEHFDAGLKTTYHVTPCGRRQYPAPPPQAPRRVRRYYVAAVERLWDYSPQTIHPLTGADYSNPSHPQYFRVQTDGKFIGSRYTKALYREFTDASFQTEVQIGPADVHRGILGPFLRAEVGEVLEVVFGNMASRAYSIHPQGLKYDKTSEGMRYEMDGGHEPGDAVPPGTIFTYRWEVPASSGPGPNGPNCVGSIYHSATNPTKDTYSGLVGPLVICRPGMLENNGSRRDSVHREFALLFQAFNENKSWYIDKNIQDFAPNADTTTSEFEESNMYDSINGLIFGNVQGLIANRGENIAWYVMGLGASEDIHTVHFHGQIYQYKTDKKRIGDVIEVFPGTYETVEMFASNPGTWLVHCHVGQHTRDGMILTYTVL